MVATALMSLEEFKQLPEDGLRHELIRGVLYRMPPTKPRHGRVTSNAVFEITGFVRANALGAVYDQSGIVLPDEPDTLIEPDVAFVQRAHLPADEDEFPVLAPDLVVEVVSPSNTGPSLRLKTEIYLRAGVRMVWIVDPRHRTVRVRKPDGTDRLVHANETLEGEDVLPGFHLHVAQLFI